MHFKCVIIMNFKNVKLQLGISLMVNVRLGISLMHAFIYIAHDQYSYNFYLHK